MSISDPDVTKFGDKFDDSMLPLIGITKKMKEDFEKGNIETTNLPGHLPYDKLVEILASEVGL